MFDRTRSAALAALGLALLAAAGGCRVATLGVGETKVVSGDGLGLSFNLTGKLVAVSVEKAELPAPLIKLVPLLADSGFYVRQPGDLFRQEMLLGQVSRTDEGIQVAGDVGLPSLAGRLAVTAAVTTQPDCLRIDGRVAGGKAGDPLTVGLSLPVNAGGWLFARSILAAEPIAPASLQRYAEWTRCGDDWDGPMINHGPVTALYNESLGLALGALPGRPTVFRVSYKADEGFTIEQDVQLAAGEDGTAAAGFGFVVFRFDPPGEAGPSAGFRGALLKYRSIFPAGLSPAWTQPGRPMAQTLVAGRTVRDIERLAYLRAMEQLTRGRGDAETRAEPAARGGGAEPSPRELAQMRRDMSILLPYARPARFGAAVLDRLYTPLVSEMTAAGWEPLAGVVVAHPDLLVERYGGADDAKIFYAVHNRSEQPIGYELAINLKQVAVALPGEVDVIDRVTDERPEATVGGDYVVLRSHLGPRGTSVFELARRGGQLKADAELAEPVSPAVSAVQPIPTPSAKRYNRAVLDRLDLRPQTEQMFLSACELEKRNLADAVAYHLGLELAANPQWASDPAALNEAAGQVAQWLSGRFWANHKAVLPPEALARWLALRADPRWRMGARAALDANDKSIDVVVWDPILENEPK